MIGKFDCIVSLGGVIVTPIPRLFFSPFCLIHFDVSYHFFSLNSIVINLRLS